MEVRAHYHSLTGTNDSHNVVKFSINRLIINVDGRSINKAHTIKFVFVHYASGITFLSLAVSYWVFIKLSGRRYYFCFSVS